MAHSIVAVGRQVTVIKHCDKTLRDFATGGMLEMPVHCDA